MSFVRPEARALLLRWRELFAAGALGLLGLYWGLTSFGFLSLIGWFILGFSALLFLSFLQRVWFGGQEDGPGYVEVDEGQITYFASHAGGAVAVRELSEVSLDARGSSPEWVLRQPQLPELRIPTSSKGAADLFDAFTALPGLSAERLLQAQRDGGGHISVIWQRNTNLRIDTRPMKDHS